MPGAAPGALTDPLERRVVEEVARRRDGLVELAADLIGFDTSAGDPAGRLQEAALQAFLAERLGGAGFAVDVWQPDTAELDGSRQLVPGLTVDGPQLVARRPGAGGGRSLLLNGHIDVVPAPPEGWRSHPFRADLRDGRLYGRGACDMKGGVAAMVCAAEVLASLDVPLRGELLVNTVTEEESTGGGAVAAVAHGVRADGGLVPEPTSLRVWLGARGSMLPTITVDGRAGHAALVQPHPSEGGAVNAVEKLGLVLDALGRLREEWRGRPDHRHPHLEPGAIVPTSVAAGEWIVTYPARATLACHLTYLPAQADADGWGTRVERELEDWLARDAQRDPWLAAHPPTVEWSVDVPPCLVPVDDPVVLVARESARALGRGGAITPRTTWCDAVTFTRAGTPSICLGPGSIDDAHSVDEHVAVEELVASAQLLAVTAMRFCGVAD